MCDVRRSCFIIEDNGISVVYIIVYEFGYV